MKNTPIVPKCTKEVSVHASRLLREFSITADA